VGCVIGMRLHGVFEHLASILRCRVDDLGYILHIEMINFYYRILTILSALSDIFAPWTF
jgi:hypothetical protein